MEESPKLSYLKKRTVISTISLFFQSGYSATLGIVANLVLTILLSPKIFGIYITVLSIISLLNYFSDVGLAASLIQKKEIDEDDVKTAFTSQQLLIISLIVIGYFFTSFVKNFYQLPREGIYLYWALLFSFFLSSLKTIPSVFLERKIEYQKIVLVQIVENTVFYLTVIFFALARFGLLSFVFAVLFRAIVGLILIYSISFWFPKVGISFSHLRELLSFGLPFQASSFLALFKDDLITLYLGKVLGFEGLGYIGWAKKWAEAPMRIVMDNLSRVLFPLISRLQHNKEKISRLVEKILNYQTMLLAPTISGLALTMNLLVFLIPKYNKWQPALPLFYLFCLSALFSSYSTPFINLFNALGKVKISFSFMIFWTVSTWILTTLLTRFFGFYGFPITQVVLSATFVLVVYQAKKLISFNFLKPIYQPLITAFLMSLVVFLLVSFTPASLFNLIVIIFLAAIIYFVLLLILFKINLINEVKKLFSYG
jgi:O-antigen/teichoic acid export membrane protein